MPAILLSVDESQKQRSDGGDDIYHLLGRSGEIHAPDHFSCLAKASSLVINIQQFQAGEHQLDGIIWTLLGV
jgi:hypothetical protein